MTDWKILRKHLLEDKKVAREYERLKPQYELISQVIKARRKNGLTQVQLAKKIGTKQSAIARFESGNANPSIEFLGKLVNALGSKLVIQIR